MRPVARHKGRLPVLLEEPQPRALQITAEILHQLHREPLLTLHLAPQQRKQRRCQHPTRNVARHRNVTHHPNHIPSMMLPEMRLHLRPILQRHHRRLSRSSNLRHHRRFSRCSSFHRTLSSLHRSRGNLSSFNHSFRSRRCRNLRHRFRRNLTLTVRTKHQRHILHRHRLRFLPARQRRFILLNHHPRLVPVQRHVAEPLAVQSRHVPLKIMVIGRPQRNAGKTTDRNRREFPLRRIQRHILRTVELLNRRRPQHVPDRFLMAQPERPIHKALIHLRWRRRCRWRFRPRFRLALRRPRLHRPHPHKKPRPVLHEQSRHIKHRIRTTRRLDLPRHRLNRPRIRNQSRLPPTQRRRPFPAITTIRRTRPAPVLPLMRRPRPTTKIPSLSLRAITPRRPILSRPILSRSIRPRPTWPARTRPPIVKTPLPSRPTRPRTSRPTRPRSTRPARTRPAPHPASATTTTPVIPLATTTKTVAALALPTHHIRRHFAPHHFRSVFLRQILHPVGTELKVLELGEINGVGLAHDINLLVN